MIEPWMTCPECYGIWSRNYVWVHVPNGCSIGAAEDSRQYADFANGRTYFERPATHAEMRLAEHVAGVPVIQDAELHDPMTEPPTAPPVITTVRRLAPGIFHRVVGGVDVPERSEVAL